MKSSPGVLATKPPVEKRGRRISDKVFPYLLIAPTAILILLVMVYPIFRVFYLSFQNYDLTNPFMDGFAGISNFVKLFTDDPLFFSSIGITFKWVLLQVVFQLLLGLIVALILNAKFRGRGVVRAISLVPWAVSGVLITMLWSLMYDQNSGLFNDLLIRMGILKGHIAWLADNRTFFAAIIVAELWRGIPFFAITLLASLQSIPEDIYESSAIDGCGAVRNLIYITLPFLKESIIFATLLRAIWEFNSIDMIFTMTNGGPMDQTTTLPIYMMKTAIIQGNYGYGSAIGVVSFLFLMLFAALYIKISGYGGEDA
ncbi:sugar ABC transporter permease [Caproiciproducens galactitolivorans]|uniref:Trehalose transport system permease protein SugA n=1 Tax=Caproiciproducens galactitolivorans TaxID=642589 RepID=A0A4Z0YH50_9FIRM|nr:sugar ABC transporter permease [Caproiciproducens galactitolivorans]QEY35280.1 sugar ABC transporter permease [Caproiciproducens galactitolivorans]TGJ76976.1 trehalose transport system permease protein SugA [Caproiciproducens galactitolivorans]